MMLKPTYSAQIFRLRVLSACPNHVASIGDGTGSPISTVSIDLLICMLVNAGLLQYFDTHIDIYLRLLRQRRNLPRWFLACGCAEAGQEGWRCFVVRLADFHLI